jgi:N-acetyl-anhydromuramyl-L-alanine amidase AmpD
VDDHEHFDLEATDDHELEDLGAPFGGHRQFFDRITAMGAIAAAWAQGERDPVELTDRAFAAMHPDLGGRRIQPHEQQLKREWLELRDGLVVPFVRQRSGASAPPGASVGGIVRCEPAAYAYEDGRMEGYKSAGSVRFQPAAGEPRDLAIFATAAAEGKHDTVNLYDKGIVSWGVMQWSLHAGSLQRMLAWTKGRLTEDGRAERWASLFPGLDVRGTGSDATIVADGRAIPTSDNAGLRMTFRGRADRQADEAVACRWVRVFALAGREPLLVRLQTEYARLEVDRALDIQLGRTLARYRTRCGGAAERKSAFRLACRRLTLPESSYRARYGTIREYVASDPLATTLLFGTWTNNPVASHVHLASAIDDMAARHGSHQPPNWPAGWPRELAARFEAVLRASSFAYWGDAKARASKRASRTEKLVAGHREAERLTAGQGRELGEMPAALVHGASPAFEMEDVVTSSLAHTMAATGDLAGAVKLAMASGQTDEYGLASLLFHARHPERKGARIDPPREALALLEYKTLLNDWVRPLLAPPVGRVGDPAWTERVPSPYCGSRGTHEVEAILYHFTAGPRMWNKDGQGGTVGYFQSNDRRVSIHYVIGKDGRTVQMCELGQAAHHAGESTLGGRTSVNARSIGIELVNFGPLKAHPRHRGMLAGGHRKAIPYAGPPPLRVAGGWWEPFTPQQYESLTKVTAYLLRRFPAIRWIVGHQYVAPGRRNDPGEAFDWARMKRALPQFRGSWGPP